MGLESAANIGLLIAIVGLMLFFLRRMDRIRDELKAEINQLKADANLRHTEVRQDLQDVRGGLVQVRERQARLEGILEGMGHTAPTPEPAATAE